MSAGLSQIKKKSRAIAERKAAAGEEYGVSSVLSVTDLVEDPDNRELYGEYESDALAESITESGFIGRVYAYPTDDGKYMIESGHRSLEAAVKSGLDRVPVIITTPPADDLERRTRLVRHNLHTRKETVERNTSLVQYLYNTYEQKYPADTKASIVDRIAKDLEISAPMVYKYRQLASLVPELKELAFSEKYSWIAISGASKLTDNQQLQLAERIKGNSRISGPDGVTKDWILNEIEEFRYVPENPTKLNFDPRNIFDGITPSDAGKVKGNPVEARPARRVRRCDGAKAVYKANESLRLALSDDSFVKAKETSKVREALFEIRELAEKCLKKFE